MVEVVAICDLLGVLWALGRFFLRGVATSCVGGGSEGFRLTPNYYLCIMATEHG